MHLASTAVLNRISSSFLRSGRGRKMRRGRGRKMRRGRGGKMRSGRGGKMRRGRENQVDGPHTYDFASLGSNEAVRKSS